MEETTTTTPAPVASPTHMGAPDDLGFFGEFGGRYVGEPLIGACEEVERAFVDAWGDPSFRHDFSEILRTYAGRPSPITGTTGPLRDAGVPAEMNTPRRPASVRGHLTVRSGVSVRAT